MSDFVKRVYVYQTREKESVCLKDGLEKSFPSSWNSGHIRLSEERLRSAEGCAKITCVNVEKRLAVLDSLI